MVSFQKYATQKDFDPPGPKWYQRGNINNLFALIPNLKLRKKIKALKPDIIHINDKAALSAGISTCRSWYTNYSTP